MKPSHSGQRDDGFRTSEDALERAVANVLATPKDGHKLLWLMRGAAAAAVALILGLGGGALEGFGPKTCETFACQMESLTDEELSVMVDLIDEDGPWGLEADDPLLSLY